MSRDPLPPLVGALLVGGSSRRFGSPKALARLCGVTLAERVAAALAAVADEVVVAGAGELPPALSALAHESRLEAFRLLVRSATEGISAGDLASQLRVAPPTMSFHLSHLARAGLIESQRAGRSVLYSLRVEGIRDLVGFLTEECCQGRPELCAPDRGQTKDCGA